MPWPKFIEKERRQFFGPPDHKKTRFDKIFSWCTPGISDHCAVLTELDIDPSYRRTKPRPVRQFKKANWEAISQQIIAAGPSFQKTVPAVLLMKIG